MTYKKCIDLLYEGKISIYAMIYLDRELQAKMQSIMNDVPGQGNTYWLNTRDSFFTYDKERECWYGRQKSSHPFFSVEKLIEIKNDNTIHQHNHAGGCTKNA